MAIPFRQRVFLVLVGLGTVPLGAALIALALQVRSTGPSAGPRAALDDIAASGRVLIEVLDTAAVSDTARAALRRHTETIGRGTTLARRAETLSRFAAGALGGVVLLAAIVLIGVSLHLARRWSREVSAPIDELIDWVQRIQDREPLPARATARSAPEFDKLRDALRQMSDALEAARRQELERERLVAFREVAQRVAHEIRGPLTSSRLALGQLSKAASLGAESEVTVLRDEIDRLEAMAREFSDFGRLPEGPEAPVDMAELLESVIPATVPGGTPLDCSLAPDLTIQGHYEPLRRAVQNLLRNAVEVADDRGITVLADRCDHGAPCHVRLRIVDHGPGIPVGLREQIFEPYFTTKKLGTGLGLAMVKQTVEGHGGRISVVETPGGGATFLVELPEHR